GDAVIDNLRRLHGDLEWDGVITLRRRRRDDLNIDAHGIEVRQSVVVPDSGSNVGFLFLTERSSLGISEMRKRYCGPIEIWLDEHRRRRFCDMGMNIDGYALWPHLVSRPAVPARGGPSVFVPLRRHACSSLTRRVRHGGFGW